MSSKRKSNNNQDDESISESSKKRTKTNRNKENVQPNNKPCSSNLAATPQHSQTQSGTSQSSIRSIPNNQMGLYLTSQDQRIDDLIAKANESIFEKKIFTIGQSKREYCAIYNFFESELVFAQQPENPIPFKCIFCKAAVKCIVGKPSNLTKHLQSEAKLTEIGTINHDKLNNEWYPLYLKSNHHYDEGK